MVEILLQNGNRDTNSDETEEEEDDLPSWSVADLKGLSTTEAYLVRRENGRIDMTQSVCDQTPKLLTASRLAMVTYPSVPN